MTSQSPDRLAVAFVRIAYREPAARKQSEHVVASVVEVARSIAALAVWPVTEESQAEYVDCMLCAQRHRDAAEAWGRVVVECDALIATLSTEEAP